MLHNRELLELIIVFITAFAGALGGGVAGYLLGLHHSRKTRREERTYDVANEFFTLGMVDIRRDGYKSLKSIRPEDIIEKYGSVNLRHLFKHLAELGKENEARNLRKVLDYFNKVGSLLNTGALDKKLIRQLLGFYVSEWSGYLNQYMTSDNEGDEWKELHRNITTLYGFVR